MSQSSMSVRLSHPTVAQVFRGSVAALDSKPKRTSNSGRSGRRTLDLGKGGGPEAEPSLTRAEAEGPARASSGRNQAELEGSLECQHPFHRQPATESTHPNGSGRTNRGANSASGPPQPWADHLSVRRAGPEDAETIAALFQSVYRDSSHPFHSTASVSEFLADARNFEIVAEEDNRVVASMAMTCNAWNDSYELGRALTRPEYRRNGLAAFLMQEVVDWVASAGLGELIFGYPRVRRIADLCAALDPEITVVGHDAGRNVANGSRETHLIVCGVPRHALFTHVAPRVAELRNWRFLRERIYSPLGLSGAPGEYPSESFIGAVPQSELEVGAWRFDYVAGSPSGALEAVSRQHDGATPQQMSAELTAILSGMPDVQHVTATVLADKAELIRALAGCGFEIVAYLPAWHWSGGCRYDCVQLARRLYTGQPTAQDFADLLSGLQAEFRSCPLVREREGRRAFAA